MPDDPTVIVENPEGSTSQDNPSATPIAAAVVKDWREALPPELRTEKSLSNVKDVSALAKGYVESQRFVGRSIRIPDDKMKPDEAQKAWNDVYTKLGRPDSPEQYAINVSDPLKPFLSEDRLTAVRPQFHALGLSQKQVQGVMDIYAKQVESDVTTTRQVAKETEAALREEWGGAFDRNLGLAARTVREMGGQDLLQYLDQTGLGNSPALVKTFARIGSLLAEEGYIAGAVEGVDSPDDAKSRINEVMGDRKHPYWVAKHPGHEDAIAEMARLHQLAFPEAT